MKKQKGRQSDLKKIDKVTTTKIALLATAILLFIWSILGAGASLAWFADETPVVKNIFNFSRFEIEVTYKDEESISYKPVEIDTNIFGFESIYEPGYTRISYLKVKNIGTVDIKYKLSLDVRRVVNATSAEGTEIYLPDYIKYGVRFADGEEDLTREIARERAPEYIATMALNTFSEWDTVTLEPGQERYIALVTYMPEQVGNEANYRDVMPEIEVGITVYAEQAHT